MAGLSEMISSFFFKDVVTMKEGRKLMMMEEVERLMKVRVRSREVDGIERETERENDRKNEREKKSIYL